MCGKRRILTKTKLLDFTSPEVSSKTSNALSETLILPPILLHSSMIIQNPDESHAKKIEPSSPFILAFNLSGGKDLVSKTPALFLCLPDILYPSFENCKSDIKLPLFPFLFINFRYKILLAENSNSYQIG